MSAAILDPVTTELINPWDDEYNETTHQYPARVNERFTYMLRIVCIIFTALAVIGTALTF